MSKNEKKGRFINIDSFFSTMIVFDSTPREVQDAVSAQVQGRMNAELTGQVQDAWYDIAVHMPASFGAN